MTYRSPKPITSPVPQHMEYQGRPSPPIARAQRQRFKFWYDDIIDWMLVNPDKSVKECAKYLGRSAETLYTITNTDIFKSRLSQRRQDLNIRMADAIAGETSAVALMALQEVRKRIADNPAAIPIGQLVDISDKTLNRLGYGVSPVVNGPQSVTNNTIVAVSPSVLRDAQDAMRRIQDVNSTVEPPPQRIERTIEHESEYESAPKISSQ